ncbi:hypothetical protein [Streptomyces yangpuensis]|uniref:hypothetical protein n=1 Tax=Streptomyces yangpuensis TaxID=1648182 RepID=UPI0036504658
MEKKDVIRWAPAALALTAGLAAPLFGDSPTAVVMPLVLAAVLAGGGGLHLKMERARGES